MAEILNAHGSKNDIFVARTTPGDFASAADLRAFVRILCDRNGPFGGDGVYFCELRPRVPEAWFFNPDGSAAEFCGNGMRCLGRMVLDERGAEAALIRSGEQEYTVRRGPTTAEGVRQVIVEHPPVSFGPRVVTWQGPMSQAPRPRIGPFTAVSVPNPHLVAVVDIYVESDLVAMGHQLATPRPAVPAGANVSVLLPLGHHEVFVRTFERGAGLTASCGSAMAASRAVYSRIGRAAPERDVTVRNVGGVATASLRARDGRWFPVLQGNATFVYRADVDPDPRALAADPGREPCQDEVRAYAALDKQNAARLRAAGVELG